MKHFGIRSHRRPEHQRRSALLLLLAAFFASACVTRGVYEEDVGQLENENRALSEKVENLTRSNRTLDAERVELMEGLEDLRLARETLERDVAKLERSKVLLTEHLRQRDEQVTELSRLSSTYEGLVTDLQDEVTAGQIEIEQLRDGIQLNLPQDILFPSGSVELQDSGQAVLQKVAARLGGVEHRIEVEGHTDNVRLSRALTRRFGTNWELAAARASQVVRLFEAQGVDPDRMIAISRGAHQPVESNDTAEGRARNRRIEIRLIPQEVIAGGAAAAPPASGGDASGTP